MICSSTLSKATMSDERLCYDNGEGTMKEKPHSGSESLKRYGSEVEQA